MNPYQLDNGPTRRQKLRVKSSQITSSHTGRTVATPAYNRAHRHAIRHATHSPEQLAHLGQTRRKTPQTHPGPGPKNHPHQLPAQSDPRSPRSPLRRLTAHHLTDYQHHREGLRENPQPTRSHLGGELESTRLSRD